MSSPAQSLAMRIDDGASITVVGLGPDGIRPERYNVINDYVVEKARRTGEQGHWAYMSADNYEAYQNLVIGKPGENTVADNNFNLQLGFTQLYLEAHDGITLAVKNIVEFDPKTQEGRDLQTEGLRDSKKILDQVKSGIRNSWDLQGALHMWRSHWQGARPQDHFGRNLYREILQAWKRLRDQMGSNDDMVGVGWLDGWIKAFMKVYELKDDFYQQFMTWNIIHDVGDADFAHPSIRLWQSEINQFRFKHRKTLDIPSTIEGIKERLTQFRQMIIEPNSSPGWAIGGCWYWQDKTEQFRALVTQLIDLEFRQRLEEAPAAQHKFEELDRLALNAYISTLIAEFNATKKSTAAEQMLRTWHSTFGLLTNYDMICTGYLWSYIKSTSQMDTDVFILSYQDIEAKEGGWTCPVTVELLAGFQIGLRGFIKRRAENRTRKKRGKRVKSGSEPEKKAEPVTSIDELLPGDKKSDMDMYSGGSFTINLNDVELVHDDGKPIFRIQNLSRNLNQEAGQKVTTSMGDVSSVPEIVPPKKKKKRNKRKQLPVVQTPHSSCGPHPQPDKDLLPAAKHTAESVTIDDAWQAAKQEFIGHRVTFQSASAGNEPERDSFLDDADRLKRLDVFDGTRSSVEGFSRQPSSSAFDWFEETTGLIETAAKGDKDEDDTNKHGTQTQQGSVERIGLKGTRVKKDFGGPKSGNKPKDTSHPKPKSRKGKQPVLNSEGKPKPIDTTMSAVEPPMKILPDNEKGKSLSSVMPVVSRHYDGPIGEIVPSRGPWTQVGRKKKPVQTESETKRSVGDHVAVNSRTKDDRHHGRADLSEPNNRLDDSHSERKVNNTPGHSRALYRPITGNRGWQKSTILAAEPNRSSSIRAPPLPQVKSQERIPSVRTTTQQLDEAKNTPVPRHVIVPVVAKPSIHGSSNVSRDIINPHLKPDVPIVEKKPVIAAWIEMPKAQCPQIDHQNGDACHNSDTAPILEERYSQNPRTGDGVEDDPDSVTATDNEEQGIRGPMELETLGPPLESPSNRLTHSLSAQVTEFYSSYITKMPTWPGSANFDRFSAPELRDSSPDRIDEFMTDGGRRWRSTQSESIRPPRRLIEVEQLDHSMERAGYMDTTESQPEGGVVNVSQSNRNLDQTLQHVTAVPGHMNHGGYGVNWGIEEGQAAPIPQEMLSQWLRDAQVPPNANDISELLQRSVRVDRPAPSLQQLGAVSEQPSVPTNATGGGREQGPTIAEQSPTDGYDYFSYDLIPVPEVETVYQKLKDFFERDD